MTISNKVFIDGQNLSQKIDNKYKAKLIEALLLPTTQCYISIPTKTVWIPYAIEI